MTQQPDLVTSSMDPDARMLLINCSLKHAPHSLLISPPAAAMAYSSRPTSILPGAGLRQPAAQPSSALSMRIAAKRAELENLRQLRDLSGTLAMQMQALESKIATLKDGTEGYFQA